MGYALRPGVSYAMLGDSVVFLDVDANRYLLAMKGSVAALRAMVREPDHSDDDDAAIKSLLAEGILTPVIGIHAIAPPTSIEISDSVFDDEPAKMRWRDLTWALRDIIHHERELRRRSLGELLGRRAQARLRQYQIGRRGGGVDATTRSIAIAYRRAGLLLPTIDRCLPRSIALAATLGRRGIECDLVFGVTLGPFSAHCWVQKDGVVLNDSLEHVRNFVPILVR